MGTVPRTTIVSSFARFGNGFIFRGLVTETAALGGGPGFLSRGRSTLSTAAVS